MTGPSDLLQGQLNGIPLPDAVWGTPGHYSVVALLPEDHTFAKGSLFILAPGTKCVIFDMDGELHAAVCTPCKTSETLLSFGGKQPLCKIRRWVIAQVSRAHILMADP